MTATGELTALDLARWLAGEAPDSPPCDGLDEDGCDLEALFRALWDSGCEHVAAETLLCMGHRDELEQAIEVRRFWLCRSCRKMARVVRIEPIR